MAVDSAWRAVQTGEAFGLRMYFENGSNRRRPGFQKSGRSGRRYALAFPMPE
jgi:hypothetical protein